MMEYYTNSPNIDDGMIRVERKRIEGSFRQHTHEFLEIEYILSGSGKYRIDGEEYEIAEGMLFFMSPTNFHSVETEGAEVYNIMFSENFCDPIYVTRAISRGASAVHFEGEGAVFIESLLRELLASYDDEVLSSHLLSCIMARVSRAEGERRETPVSRAALYALTHFRSSPSLSDVAALVGFTPSYFSELFREQTGITYKKWLNNAKFDYAKKLLLFTDMTVLEVSAESGFSDYPNFVRRFKERYGITPTAFRSRT